MVELLDHEPVESLLFFLSINKTVLVPVYPIVRGLCFFEKLIERFRFTITRVLRIEIKEENFSLQNSFYLYYTEYTYNYIISYTLLSSTRS